MSAPDPAEALMRAVLPLIARGDWTAAARSLEQAAALHEQAGRESEAARCLQGAGALRAAAGESAAASVLAGRAAAAAPGDPHNAAVALAQQGAAAAAEGAFETAAAQFTSALAAAERAGLGGDDRIALWRGLEAAHIRLGDLAAARGDVDAACALADGRMAGFLRTEQARLLIDAGRIEAARRALPPPPTDDPQLRAEILVERARLARSDGDGPLARATATDARASARSAVAPVPYFAAAVEQCEALDMLGDRPGAYEALTSAWGSLSDLLGAEVAKSWVEPCLLALKLRWGEAGFDAVKAAHDAGRKAASQPQSEGAHP
jgi:tetratricopeptide (TPR) repeat protein